MKLPFFRTRSPHRDLASDTGRLRHLMATLRTLEQECAAEEQGLKARFESSQKQATAVLSALESGDEGVALKSRLDGYEDAMMHCERRLEQLKQHRAYFADLRMQVESGPMTEMRQAD